MKKLVSTLIIIAIFVFSACTPKENGDAIDNKEARSDRIASALEKVWDEYGLFSLQIGETDSTIRIEMDETKSEEELREYLMENIEQSDLSHYNIEVSRKSREEIEKDHAMMLIQGIILDYIMEKDYTDVEVKYTVNEPKPILIITIPETSDLSSEDLKAEVSNLLASQDFDSIVKDVSYEIQVIKL